jgi:hypothetical protein
MAVRLCNNDGTPIEKTTEEPKCCLACGTSQPPMGPGFIQIAPKPKAAPKVEKAEKKPEAFKPEAKKEVPKVEPKVSMTLKEQMAANRAAKGAK